MAVDLPLELVVFITLFSGALCSYIAFCRGRHRLVWFVVGFLFGLIGLVVLLSMKKLERPVGALAIGPAASTPSAQALSAPLAQIEASVNWYYINAKKETIGPMSLPRLQELRKSAQVLETTYVWDESMDDWKKVKDLPDFQTPSSPLDSQKKA